MASRGAEGGGDKLRSMPSSLRSPLKFFPSKLYLVRFFALEENFTNAVFVQVTMTVDDLRVDRWRTEGSFSVLASSRASVGGSSEPYRMPGGGGAGERNNFVGCMKKVRVSLTFLRI